MIHNNNGLIEVYGDAVILFDLHIPFQSWEILKKVRQYCSALGIKTAVYGGDQWNMGSHGKHKRGVTDTWKETKITSRAVFGFMDEFIDDHVLICGNHDEWYFRKQDYAQDMDELVDLCVRVGGNVHWTNKDFCVIRTIDECEDWRITHSRNYSKLPGALPRRIGKKFRMNCAQGHDHMLARYSLIKGNREHVYINGGCCLDLERMAYERDRTTTHGIWASGFLTLIEGRMSVVHGDDSRLVTHKIKADTYDNVTNGEYLEVWERKEL